MLGISHDAQLGFNDLFFLHPIRRRVHRRQDEQRQHSRDEASDHDGDGHQIPEDVLRKRTALRILR